MFSLVLTLFVVPAMYTYLSRRKKRNELDVMDEEEQRKKIAEPALV
jgi:multidrug efflux pump